MIPHSLIFSFIQAHFGLRQNPTGLQEAIQGSDKNSKTTLIIKSTLERLFLMKKHQKKHFWNFALFTRFNLDIAYRKKKEKSTLTIFSVTPAHNDFIATRNCRKNWVATWKYILSKRPTQYCLFYDYKRCVSSNLSIICIFAADRFLNLR